MDSGLSASSSGAQHIGGAPTSGDAPKRLIYHLSSGRTTELQVVTSAEKKQRTGYGQGAGRGRVLVLNCAMTVALVQVKLLEFARREIEHEVTKFMDRIDVKGVLGQQLKSTVDAMRACSKREVCDIQLSKCHPVHVALAAGVLGTTKASLLSTGQEREKELQNAAVTMADNIMSAACPNFVSARGMLVSNELRRLSHSSNICVDLLAKFKAGCPTSKQQSLYRSALVRLPRTYVSKRPIGAEGSL